VEDGFTLAGQIPQRIPAKCWARLYYFHGGAGRRHVPKHADRADFSTWLFHNPPPGTVYNVDARTGAFSMTKIPEAGERFATLNQFAPWEVSLVEAMINGRFSGEVGYEERLTLYQSVAEYSLIPNTSLAELVRDQPGRYEFHTLRAAKLDPYFFLPMAAYFESVDEEKAQKYYEIGIAQCPDRVAVSKYCGWLVSRYFDQGRREDAYRIADEMAEVYSFSGLKLKSDLLFRDGRFEESLELIKALDERYGAEEEVQGWYSAYQAKTGDRKYANLVDDFVNDLFPGGIQKAAIEDFAKSPPPKDGVVFLERNAKTMAAGLSEGAVIVALNGQRVADFPQYRYLRSLLTHPDMHFIVWTGREYVERSARLDDHLFGVDMDTYEP
ncbi:MAG: hypothetical protein KDL87_15515, partial [Verrucomicrobiae bacterium]|nr:hypothetical protein [Verrucomicrobiae bacterium]